MTLFSVGYIENLDSMLKTKLFVSQTLVCKQFSRRNLTNLNKNRGKPNYFRSIEQLNTKNFIPKFRICISTETVQVKKAKNKQRSHVKSFHFCNHII